MNRILRVSAVAVAPLLFACGSTPSGGAATDLDAGPTPTPTPSGMLKTGDPCPSGSLIPKSVGIVDAIVGDGATVYFTSSPNTVAGDSLMDPSFVYSVPASGGAPTQLATGKGGTDLSSFAVGANDAVFFLDHAIQRVAKTGGAASTVWSPNAYAIAWTFASDGTNVYTTPGGSPYDILSVPAAGGSPTKIFTSTTKNDASVSAVDGDSVYYVDSTPIEFSLDGGATPPATHTIFKVAKTGGTPQQLAVVDAGLSVWQLSVDSGVVVYSTLDPKALTPGGFYTVPTTGGTPTVLIPKGKLISPPFGINGGFVYVGGEGGLQKVPVTGGALQSITSSYQDSTTISADATNVYWGHQGCLYKVAH